MVRTVVSIAVRSLVGGGVVWSTEECEVAEAGVASVRPVGEVVCVAP